MNTTATTVKSIAPITASHATGNAIAWVAVVGLVALAALRCVVPFNPDPHWSAAEGGAPEVGAFGAALLDWLAMVVLVLAMSANLLRGQRVWWGLAILWLLGLIVALHHGSQHADSLRLAGNWAGALALGLAAIHLGCDSRHRRLILAALVALIIPLGIQALYQIGVEHPTTIAGYEEQRADYLESRGWAEGSLEHRKFEERLYQLQATGRFALGNVLGTVMATLALAAVGFLAAMLAGRSRRAKWGGAALAVVAALAFTVVIFTFSRGAILAIALGLGAAAVACILTWRFKLTPRISGRSWAVLLLAVVIFCLGAVVLRGLVFGEPDTAAGERSLLFRWHYWQAAASMFAERPLVGVGPGNFQNACLLHKNPLSPEDVNDPHSVFIAYIATLGLAGFAWAALLLSLLWHAAKSLGSRAAIEPTLLDADEPQPARRARWLAVAAIAVLAFGTQYVIELPRYWIDAALLWMLATGCWIALAGWLAGRREIDTRYACVGLFAAVAAMIAHAQIELSLTSTMAPPLLLAFLGITAGSPQPAPSQASVKRFAPPTALAFTGVALIVVLTMLVVPIARQQSHLAEAARQAAAGRIHLATEALAAAGADGLPPNPRIAQHAVQLYVQRAENAHQRRDTRARDVAWAAARDSLEAGRAHGSHASLWRLELAISNRAYQLTQDEIWKARTLAAAEAMLPHDPHSLQARLLAADAAWELGEQTRAAQWYRDVLTLNEQAYLDPNRQLTPDQNARVQQRLDRG
ncbi:MAG: O-antigen ligase family protein [Phycisphaeraceae bacterium]